MENKIIGYIYILTNPALRDYVKIGYAKDVDRRLQELNSCTAVPLSFRKYATYAVETEREDLVVHKWIDTLDPEARAKETLSNGKMKRREFFSYTAEKAFEILKAYAITQRHEERLTLCEPTEEERQENEFAEKVKVKNQQRTENFKFSHCNIDIGEFIEWHTDEGMKFEVISDKKVKYKGEEWALTPLAKEITGKPWVLCGPNYFKYKGEYLNDLRRKYGTL